MDTGHVSDTWGWIFIDVINSFGLNTLIAKISKLHLHEETRTTICLNDDGPFYSFCAYGLKCITATPYRVIHNEAQS